MTFYLHKLRKNQRHRITLLFSTITILSPGYACLRITCERISFADSCSICEEEKEGRMVRGTNSETISGHDCRDNRGCSLPLFTPRLSRGEGEGRKWSRSLKLFLGGENWRKIPFIPVPKSSPEFRRRLNS